MRRTLTGPNTFELRFEPGDYVCLTDHSGTPVVDWQMAPERMALTFRDLPTGMYFVGLRHPCRDELLWWGDVGPFRGGIPVYAGGDITLILGPGKPESVAKPAPRRRWWRRG